VIRRSGLHAIRALAVLARLERAECAGAAAIADEIDAPPNYLGKLLQTLALQGLVESRKGLGGGFRLARPAGEIRLLDVIDPIEQVSRWNRCFLGQPQCSDETACAVHTLWGRTRDAYLELLSKTTIADLVRRKE
jgi:Rrf2 family protein